MAKGYIALEDFDFYWTEERVLLFRDLWEQNVPFNLICRRLQRHRIEVAILLIDQAQKGLVKHRKIGLGLNVFIGVISHVGRIRRVIKDNGETQSSFKKKTIKAKSI